MLQAAKLETLQLGPEGKLQQAPMWPMCWNCSQTLHTSAHPLHTPCILLCHASASAATCDKRIATENSPRIASTRTQSGNARYTLRLCYTFNQGRLHVFAEAHAVFCYPFTLLLWQEFSLLRISLLLPELWATHYLPQKTIQISTLKPALESSCISFVVARGSRRKDECFSAILIYVKADSHLIV